MKTVVALLSTLTILGAQSAFASLVDDLGSPVQATRDRAAAELRRTFRSTPGSKWTPTLDQIKPGQTRQEILELLRPFGATPSWGVGSGQSHTQAYQLDDEWALVCTFRHEGNVGNEVSILIDRKLAPSVRRVRCDPPANFTGTWVVYFVNGQKSYQINCRDGRYFGEFIAYHPDGSKACVQHYVAHVADGDDTGYYPTGKIAYRGQYRSDKQVGTWTWYDEAGKITSTQEHEAP
jgi:hypothetical protein